MAPKSKTKASQAHSKPELGLNLMQTKGSKQSQSCFQCHQEWHYEKELSAHFEGHSNQTPQNFPISGIL